MLKNVLVIMGCLGLMSTANAENEAARGQQINLASVNNEDAPPYVSILEDLDGEDGYLMVTLDEESLSELPRQMTNIGPGFTISQACSFVPAASYGSQSQYVRVHNTNARYVNDDRVVVSVQLLMGDGENQPSSLACSYSINASDVEEHGQGVFSVEFMKEKGHLPEDVFNFDVDARQLMLDNSTPV